MDEFQLHHLSPMLLYPAPPMLCGQQPRPNLLIFFKFDPNSQTNVKPDKNASKQACFAGFNQPHEETIMKKALLISLLLAFAAGTAIAQNNNGFGQGDRGNGRNGSNGEYAGGNQRVERMTEQLGLDEAQQAQITAIFENSQALHAEEQERFRQMSEEFRDNANAEILLLLTPEQAAMHTELQQQRAEFRRALEDARGEGGYGRGGHGTGECGN
jgi:Spy/CpxP family protein refolding chaperone